MVNATSRTPNSTNPTRMHPIAYGSRNARMNRSASVGESGPRSAPADAVDTFAAPDDVDSTTICPARLVVRSAAAAPVAPHFGPTVQSHVPPAYRASFSFPVPPPSIAAGTDGAVCLAFGGWSGSSTGDDIYVTKSLNDGRSWSTPVRVNDDSGPVSQVQPSLSLDPANNIYVAWTDMRGGTNDVYFSKSANGGLSFSSNVRLNDVVTDRQSEPHLAVDPGNPHPGHAVWTGSRSPITRPDLYYANSTDGGLSFNPSVRVNDDVMSAEQGQPTIAVAPNRDVYA